MKNTSKNNLNKLTEKELRLAYIIWHKHYNFNSVEDRLLPYLNNSINSFSEKNHDAWLEKSRKALFLSAQTIANSLNISRAAYSQLESSEKNGTIILERLAKTADAGF